MIYKKSTAVLLRNVIWYLFCSVKKCLCKFLNKKPPIYMIGRCIVALSISRHRCNIALTFNGFVWRLYQRRCQSMSCCRLCNDVVCRIQQWYSQIWDVVDSPISGKPFKIQIIQIYNRKCDFTTHLHSYFVTLKKMWLILIRL